MPDCVDAGFVHPRDCVAGGICGSILVVPVACLVALPRFDAGTADGLPSMLGILTASKILLQQRGKLPVLREQRKLAAILAKDVVGGSAQAASSDKVGGNRLEAP